MSKSASSLGVGGIIMLSLAHTPNSSPTHENLQYSTMPLLEKETIKKIVIL